MNNKNIKFEVSIYDCTIIKLGGSYAVSLPVKKLEKKGFKLGMPVKVDLSFDMERDTEICNEEINVQDIPNEDDFDYDKSKEKTIGLD